MAGPPLPSSRIIMKNQRPIMAVRMFRRRNSSSIRVKRRRSNGPLANALTSMKPEMPNVSAR